MTDGSRLTKFDCRVGDLVGLQEVPKWVNGQGLSPRLVVGTVIGAVDASQSKAGGQVFESTIF